MQHDAFSCIVLRARIEGDLKAACGFRVTVEVVLELSSELELDLLDRSDGMAPIASAAAVLELNEVRSVLVAKDFIGNLGRRLHIIINGS